MREEEWRKERRTLATIWSGSVENVSLMAPQRQLDVVILRFML